MKKLQVLLSALLVLAIVTITIFAAGPQKQVTAQYGVTVKLDGRVIDYTYPNGQKADALVIDGVTYLPVRAVSEAIGKSVAWDETTQTVSISSDAGQTSGQSGSVIRVGMYLVGQDIPAGTYKLTADGDTGYWARASDASGELDSIIANDLFSQTAYVTVKNGEYFELSHCSGVLQ